MEVLSDILRSMRVEGSVSPVQQLHNNPEASWTLEKMTEDIGMSRAAFAKTFKKHTGTTPTRFRKNTD